MFKEAITFDRLSSATTGALPRAFEKPPAGERSVLQPQTTEVILRARAVLALFATAFSLACGATHHALGGGSTCHGLPPDTRPDELTRAPGSFDDVARAGMAGGLIVVLTDVETRRAVDGAMVHLWAGDRMLPPAEHPSPDTDGIHTFVSIPAGFYVVRASRLGYRSQVLAHEIRPGFTDTLKIAWQMRALCIVE